MKHHAQGNFLHLKTRCQRAQRRSLASVRINALNQYTQIDLLPPPSSILPKYDLDGQQKSAKGKALQQPDRDFEACARLNEHKSEERYPAKERQQSVTAYVDELGDVRAAYALDAFGQTISQGGDMASTFSHRFSTKYADDETGLYYYGFRFYAPGLGRWVSRDPIEESGGVNMYGLCGNEALNKTDLLGMMSTVTWNNDKSIRLSAFFQLGRAILDFFDGGPSVTYSFEYPDSVSKRFLEHSKVKPIWKEFKETSRADFGKEKRYTIQHVASKLDFALDMTTSWGINIMGFPLIPDFRNFRYLDVGVRAIGSFGGLARISIKSKGNRCVKELDMTLSDQLSIESLFRNPFTRESTITHDYLSRVNIKVNYLVEEKLTTFRE